MNHWQSLVEKAQKGDKKSYHSLLTELAPYIRNSLYKNLSNEQAAEDITQEVLISVHKSLQTYNPTRPFLPWLHAIINFRRTDYLRKYYSDRSDKMSTIDDNPEFLNEHVTNDGYQGELKDIEMALGNLPKQQQRIFRMIKIEGYTAKEVANELDMNESAVKVSAHRTLKKLQESLK